MCSLMPILDFTEIPEGNRASGIQDSFELFARDCLHCIGYVHCDGPDRGADDGRDLIVEERRSGVGGESFVRWLVSCKHYAHSGRSVGVDEENNIRDRVEQHRCNGFIGFYSTLPSSGLARKLKGMCDALELRIFDHEAIETHLLGAATGLDVARRYFPRSYKKWKAAGLCQATLILDGDFSNFTTEDRQRIREVLADVLGLPIGEVRLVRVESGSIKVTFQAPMAALGRLVSTNVHTVLAERLKMQRMEELIIGDDIELVPVSAPEAEFWISRRPVTAEQYSMYLHGHPHLFISHGLDDDHLEARVSWNQAREYCKWLSGSVGALVRLPTEVEWESAARGGLLVGHLPAGTSPEPVGIVALVENVWEWCVSPVAKRGSTDVRAVAAARVLHGDSSYVVKDENPSRNKVRAGFRLIYDVNESGINTSS